jgi:hypothetical protein
MITAVELHTDFMSELDKNHTKDAPAISDKMRDYIINDSIRSLVKMYYKMGVESTEKARQALQVLIKSSEVIHYAHKPKPDNAYWYEQPTDLWEIIRIDMEANDLVCLSVVEPYLKAYENDDMLYHKKNPFKRPDRMNVLYTVEEDTIKFATDITIVPIKIHLKYLRRFTDISLSGGINSELPEQYKEEIVRIASNKAIELIQSGRLQTYMQVNGITMA